LSTDHPIAGALGKNTGWIPRGKILVGSHWILRIMVINDWLKMLNNG
jgi:hypothetical protein